MATKYFVKSWNTANPHRTLLPSVIYPRQFHSDVTNLPRIQPGMMIGQLGNFAYSQGPMHNSNSWWWLLFSSILYMWRVLISMLAYYSGLDIGARPLTQASVKIVGEYKSRITRPVCRVRFSYPEYIIQNKRNFWFPSLKQSHCSQANSLPTFWNLQQTWFVNRQKWLPLGDCYLMDVLVQSNTSGH